MLHNTLRHRAARIYRYWLAPRPSPAPFGVGRPVVVGYLRSVSGVGQSARLCLAALERLGFAPGRVDLSVRYQPQTMLDDLARDDAGGTGPLIVHANPPEIAAALMHVGAGHTRGRLIVGYWAWELEEVPAFWRHYYRFVHEVWVPSRFCAQAVARHTGKPVRVVPHPLAPPAVRRDRARFGLDDDDFMVLAAGDTRSSLARKNLAGAIAAFRAGRDGARWTMVLKLSGGTDNPAVAALLALVGGDPGIRVNTDVLSDEAMASLIVSADAILSLHRAEGFGLLPAHSLLLGTPVVATDWSGSQDFLSAETAWPVAVRLVPVDDPQAIYALPAARWAEPNIAEAAAHLRRIASDPVGARARAEAGRAVARHHCGDQYYRSCLGEAFSAAARPAATT